MRYNPCHYGKIVLFVLALFQLGEAVAMEQAEDILPAPPTVRLSLQEAMQAAVESHPSIQIAQEQIAESQAIADTRLGELLPNFSSRLSYANRRFFQSSFGGAARRSDPIDFVEARGLLSQNLFSLSLIQQWRAAKADVNVAGLDFEAKKRETMETVALVYLEVLRNQEGVKARQADVMLNKELLRLARERKAAGMATSLDVTRAQVQLEQERQRLLVAQNDHGRAMLNLIRALGITFDVTLVLTDELTMIAVPPQTVQEALAVAKEHRIELKAQMQRERLASLTYSSVKGERIPSLSANGDIGMIGNKVEDSLNTQSVQILLTVPIFDGGQREGRISENRSKVRQESFRSKDLRYQVTLEVREALLTLKSTQQQVVVARNGLQLALKELQLARERFSVGVETNIEVTEAQTSVADARDNVIEALFKFNASRVNLARAQGRLQDL